MNGRHTSHGAFRHVDRKRHTVFRSDVADFFKFEYTAARQYIGMNNGHSSRFNNFFKIFF